MTGRPYEVVKGITPRSPEWHAARRMSIGSSEAASVLGFGKWAHPLGVWLDKTGHLPHEDYDHRTGKAHTPGGRILMNAGHTFEEVIARTWAAQQGVSIARPPAVIRSRKYPWMAASLDWAVVAGPRSRTPLAPVECKLVANGRDWRNDDGDMAVPDYYVAQVWHQLVVLDAPEGHVAALINGKVEAFTIEMPAELRAEVAEAERQWWQRHVINGEQPPLDPTPHRALLDRAVPRPLRERLDITGNGDAAVLLAERQDHALRASHHLAVQDKLTDEVCALMGDAEILTWGGEIVATWKPNKNGRRTFHPKPLPQSVLDAANSQDVE